MNRTYTDTIAYCILSYLAASDWLSLRCLKLLPFSQDRIVRAVKKLQDSECIASKKTQGEMHYTLLGDGKTILQQYEPDRYQRLQHRYLDYRPLRIERESLIGEGLVAFSEAGYAAISKPDLQTMLRCRESNVYYTGKEVKQYLSCMNFGAKGENAINPSRISGVLFTGYGLIRVYSTFHTALRLRSTTESRATIPLQTLAGTRYGNRDVSLAILFGDKQYRAAQRILENSFQAANPSKNRRKPQGDSAAVNMMVTSLGSKTLYIPVIRDVLPFLALLRFPDWERRLVDICVQAVGGTPSINTRYSNGRGPKGEIFVFIGLDLVKLHYIITLFRMELPKQGVEIICMSWQADFLFDLLRRMVPDLHFSLTEINDEFLRDLSSNN